MAKADGTQHFGKFAPFALNERCQDTVASVCLLMGLRAQRGDMDPWIRSNKSGLS